MRWRGLSGIHLAIEIALSFAVVAAAAVYILSVPDIPRAQLEAQYGQPPSKFLTLADGTRVHYRVRGPMGAPVILLLHGFMGSLFVWESWAQPLSDRIQVISVDLPGHGLTGAVPSRDYSQPAMARFVLAFADKLKLKRFAIAGNSMGGDVAADFAEMHPDRVTALILIDAAGAQTHTRWRFNFVRFAAHLPFASSLAAALPPCWLFPGPHRRDAAGICGSGPMWQLARMPGSRLAILEHYRLPSDPYVWAHVKDIKAPTLILWGRDDHTIPIASAYAWRAAIPGSRLILYDHAGHLSMLDAPAQSATDVKQFVLSAAGTHD
jgi:pimeloyl-ACP methyl ester carboxylesterase